MWPDLGHRSPMNTRFTGTRRSLFVLDPTTLRGNNGLGQTDPNILSYPKIVCSMRRLAEKTEDRFKSACKYTQNTASVTEISTSHMTWTTDLYLTIHTLWKTVWVVRDTGMIPLMFKRSVTQKEHVRCRTKNSILART